jgi:hypothetical protein
VAADVTLDDEYAVRKKDVFLAVTIGEGQQGRSSILLGSKEILRTSPPIGRFLVGAGSSVRGQTLTIRTVVNDVVAATNRMSVTCRLTGGKAAAEFVSKGKVEHENDFLVFEANITFVDRG